MQATATMLLIVATLTWVPSQAIASLSNVDHPFFGPSSLTFDSTQGLYWLSPSFTAGLSYLEVQTLLLSSAAFQSFRVASLQELESLFQTAEIPDVNTPGYGAMLGTEANVPGVRFLQSLTGITHSATSMGTELTETAAFVGSPFISPVNGFWSVYIGNDVIRTNVQTQNGDRNFASAYTTWATLSVTSPTPGVGTWLVSTVPEPASALLTALGLAVISSIRVRRQQFGAQPLFNA